MERAFGDDPRVTLVREAVGREAGEADLRWPAGGLALASMSEEWVTRVRGSGRFGVEWGETVQVPVTTLDALIECHGVPAFCKIDVEGYEYDCLCGLSSPIDTISIEFTPEFLDSTENSLIRLSEIGEYRFHFSLGESLELVAKEWLTRDDVLSRIRRLHARYVGDVYARAMR